MPRQRQQTTTLRFYGLPASVRRWGFLVRQLTGREASGVARDPHRAYVDIALTPAERDLLQRQLWGSPSGTGAFGDGLPYRWHDCITYEEL